MSLTLATSDTPRAEGIGFSDPYCRLADRVMMVSTFEDLLNEKNSDKI
jgi:hypothetical protein